VTVASGTEAMGGSSMAGGGVSNDISSVPQADASMPASRLSAMNRTMDRRIQFSFKLEF
jgi:hypothetical protein